MSDEDVLEVTLTERRVPLLATMSVFSSLNKQTHNDNAAPIANKRFLGFLCIFGVSLGLPMVACKLLCTDSKSVFRWGGLNYETTYGFCDLPLGFHAMHVVLRE